MMALELSNWRAWILDTVVVLDTVLDNTHKTLSLAIKTSCHHSHIVLLYQIQIIQIFVNYHFMCPEFLT